MQGGRASVGTPHPNPPPQGQGGRGSVSAADLVVLNGRVLTLDPAQPSAEAVAARDGRILAVGGVDEIRELIGPDTQVLDAQGGLVAPAFHDAHCHLLSYARSGLGLDCRHVRSIGQLRRAMETWARRLPPGAWVRGRAYDEVALGRHPSRRDLDVAAPDHPVRLQHRSLHADVFNTRGIHLAGLWDTEDPRIERDPASGEPTGRVYHGAELFRGVIERATELELACDVRRASDALLARGVTTIQDATFTNGPSEWELFQRLMNRGDLKLRTFLFAGERHWREMASLRASGGRLCLGPVKLMLDEATSDPGELREAVAEARAAGWAVAIHAVSEAEVAIALDALRSADPRITLSPSLPPYVGEERTHPLPPCGGGLGRGVLARRGNRVGAGEPSSPPLPLGEGWGEGITPHPGPDRIEHGAVIPDALLGDLAAAHVTVVGQPALVRERGDVYRAEYPSEQHGWLHRARSLLDAGIGYAAGSDAPVTEPDPIAGLIAARTRRTASGQILGEQEVLSAAEALAAFSLWPARAVGADHELGRLRPGMLADIVVLDPQVLDAAAAEEVSRPVWATIMEGRVVWQAQGERGDDA